MHSRHELNGLTWVDLESPSREEVQDAVDQFAIEPIVAEELLLPSTKPHAEFYPSYAYLVLHFPALRHSHKTREQEIDFIVGRNFLITAHYDTIDSLHKFTKVFEVNALLEKNVIGEHAGFILLAMLKKLYKAVEHEVEYIRHDLAVIEEHIFSGHEVEMVPAISRAARDLLNLRQVIEPHREVLKEFEIDAIEFFGAEFAPNLKKLSDDYYRVHNHIMRETESLHELRESNNSLLSTKQNETMKVFTILAFTTFPLTLIAAVFSMDTKYTPIVGAPNDFWIIIAGMVAMTFCMFWYFKHKNWL